CGREDVGGSAAGCQEPTGQSAAGAWVPPGHGDRDECRPCRGTLARAQGGSRKPTGRGGHHRSEEEMAWEGILSGACAVGCCHCRCCIDLVTPEPLEVRLYPPF